MLVTISVSIRQAVISFTMCTNLSLCVTDRTMVSVILVFGIGIGIGIEMLLDDSAPRRSREWPPISLALAGTQVVPLERRLGDMFFLI